MLKRSKRNLPLRVKMAARRALDNLGRPKLNYVETHLADHCNLNCKGCYHYAPIAETRFADIREHEKDMRRLKQLFHEVRKIRLLGGEPLLHPDLVSFIEATRRIFPQSDIRIATNGILLPKADPHFWKACRDAGATIDLTVYPPVEPHLGALRILCDANGVPLHVFTVRRTIYAHHNRNGNSDRHKAFNACRKIYFCPFLRDGRLYTCWMSALVHYFNDRFGCQIPADEGIDIHSQSVTGRKILWRLSRPIETCRWCAYEFVPFPWARSGRMPEDWDAITPERAAEPQHRIFAAAGTMPLLSDRKSGH